MEMLARFKGACPFLARTKSSTLRSLSTATSARAPALSKLTVKATKCPVMGPALAIRTAQIHNSAAGYASVAGAAELEQLHRKEGVVFPFGHPQTAAGASMCPHAKAAQAAASLAREFARTHKKAQPIATAAPKTPGGFNYEQFYQDELEKKHQDKSYRYFNNINRLAAKFPVAHTAIPTEEVEVWCSNDYLGMSKNPVVIETMQSVSIRPLRDMSADIT